MTRLTRLVPSALALMLLGVPLVGYLVRDGGRLMGQGGWAFKPRAGRYSSPPPARSRSTWRPP